MVLFSDSSNLAWGGVFKGNSTGGPWYGQEVHWHINAKELQAAFFTLKAFCSQLSNTHVCFNIDNTTSEAYINSQGGRIPLLNDIARNIWLWGYERNIWLSAVHIPGVDNTLADQASRVNYSSDTEWRLDTSVFQILQNSFGDFDIDLFASRLNRQCRKFLSWRPDPDASGIDAFAHSWSGLRCYAFPPFSVMGKVLQKILQDKANVTLIAPLWPTQPWFGRLLHLCVDTPLLLPCRTTLLSLRQQPGQIHPLLRKLHLTVFRLSGDPLLVQEFHNSLPLLSCPPGDQPLWHSIGHIGPNGSNFVIKGRLLRCRFLCKT